MMFSTVASVASSCPGVVGSCTGFCDQSTVAGGAPGKKSSDTYTAPVSRFPVLSCARTPWATRLSIIFLRMASRSSPGFRSMILTPSLCGSRWIVTGTENSKVFKSICARTSATSPIRNAAKLDRRAGRQPPHRVLEDELIGLRISRRRVEGLGPVANRVKTVFSSAGGRTGSVAAVSNAMPPIRIDKTDWVCTVRPLAESDTSIPLACQKRVSGLTYWSYGRLHEHLDGQILAVLVERV